MRHFERPKIQTQFIIFNLFGDYVFPFGGAAWTSGLLQVLHVLGVSERAARSTLSRMKIKGWLLSRRQGRRSLYKLTSKGKDLLDEGARRLFGPRPLEWDGRWHLVTYSLPQEMRSVRHLLRTRLSWLGYGMLQPGTMIAAYPRKDEVLALLRDLKVEPYVDYFTDAQLENADPNEIVSRCWDLDELDRRYAQFIDRHRPIYQDCLGRYQTEGTLPLDESFVHRFWATYEFSAFPREDPGLPAELLPSDWLALEAADLVTKHRALLKAPAEAYIESTLVLHPIARGQSNAKNQRRSKTSTPLRKEDPEDHDARQFVEKVHPSQVSGDKN